MVLAVAETLSDGAESSTISRERRRVFLAAREVGGVVKDELSQLRSEVAEIKGLLTQVHQRVASFAPVVPIALPTPLHRSCFTPATTSTVAPSDSSLFGTAAVHDLTEADSLCKNVVDSPHLSCTKYLFQEQDCEFVLQDAP